MCFICIIINVCVYQFKVPLGFYSTVFLELTLIKKLKQSKIQFALWVLLLINLQSISKQLLEWNPHKQMASSINPKLYPEQSGMGFLQFDPNREKNWGR